MRGDGLATSTRLALNMVSKLSDDTLLHKKHGVKIPPGDPDVLFAADGAIVESVGSSLLLRVGVGWKLLKVDDIEVPRRCKRDDVMRLLAESASKERELLFAVPHPPPLQAGEDLSLIHI